MSSPRILAVHSSAKTRATLSRALQSLGEVDTASNIQLAARRLSRQPCQLVLAQLDPTQQGDLGFVSSIRGEMHIPVVGIVDRRHGSAALDLLWSAGLSALAGDLTEVQASPGALVQRCGALLKRRPPPPSTATRTSPRSAVTLSPRAVGRGTVIPERTSPPQNRDVPVRAIAIGVSTGGPEALRQLLPRLPKTSPPVLVVQHIQSGHSQPLAHELDLQCSSRVVEAAPNMPLEHGTVYLAPADAHLEVARTRQQLCTLLSHAAPVNRHRPSVDVLLHSVAHELGRACIGVILTGMGSDGAEGLLALHRTGARTMAQAEHCCRVFGMPKAAIARGAVDEVLDIPGIAQQILHETRQV